VILLALGSGIRQLIISLLNSLVEPHHLGMLNGVVGVLNMGGLVIAAELMSETLSTGVKLGGLWIGLPFFIAAAASAISTAVILLYRAPAVPPADILGTNPAAEQYTDEEAA
jgi:MFS transporter, PCFT/HCP family, solute carrier family 46 (folate transporter), member 1